jgi:menaquinone reductase, molybdopterin-binding-like subunit
MKMNITRRELLRFAGGSALGFLLTPIPWKALGDSANWTQNWPWIPEPRRGEVSLKLATCSLCPAACGMRARCIGIQPVSLSGIHTHPLNHGALCPAGIVAHHLRYHPSRISRPLRLTGKNPSQQTVMPIDEMLHDVAAEMKSAGTNSQTVAFVDGRPGRVASHLFRQCAANISHGTYIAVGEPSLDLLTSMFDNPTGSFSYDLDHAKTIASFGVPLFDGWGTPARTMTFLDTAPESKQFLIQIEPFQSRTAGMANQWIPIRPGTEAVFALGMASVILDEKIFHEKPKNSTELERIISSFSLPVVADVCGVSEQLVKQAARTFAANTPAVAVINGFTGSQEALAAVMMLNYLAGSIGRKGGLVLHREVPSGLKEVSVKKEEIVHSCMSSIPDHSIRVMVIDESLSGCRLPDALLQKKLTDHGIIVSISPFVTERSFCTQYVIPSSVFLESFTDLSGSYDGEASTLSISPQLVPEPPGVMNPIQFIQRLASIAGIPNVESGTMEELIKKRITAIYDGKRGMVFNAINDQTKEVKNLSSADDIWNALIAGGCWMDSAENIKSLPVFHPSTPISTMDIIQLKAGKAQLLLVPYDERTIYDSSEISPLLSKVGQESELRHFGCRAYLNPKTASDLGVSEKNHLLVQTTHGSIRAEARMDAAVMPGIIGVCSTMNPQSILELCDTNSNASPCPTPVKIQKV